MSNRSRQAAQLAALLAERTGVRVEIGWRGNGMGACCGWHVHWCDGPTEATMRAHAATLAHHVPAVDIGALRYDRGWTDLARIAAVLTYLAEHPEEVRYTNTWTVDRAFAISEYPDRSPEHIVNDARALLAHTAHTAHNSADAALCLIAEHGVNPFAVPADEQAMANVVDLSAERARRRHPGGAAFKMVEAVLPRHSRGRSSAGPERLENARSPDVVPRTCRAVETGSEPPAWCDTPGGSEAGVGVLYQEVGF